MSDDLIEKLNDLLSDANHDGAVNAADTLREAITEIEQLRTALRRCVEEIEENLEYEGRLRSFEVAAEKGREVLRETTKNRTEFNGAARSEVAPGARRNTDQGAHPGDEPGARVTTWEKGPDRVTCVHCGLTWDRHIAGSSRCPPKHSSLHQLK